MAEPWSKWFWTDYEADPGLRMSSLAAQGLWMRMLCLMAKATPKGELRVGGEPCTVTDLAIYVGQSEETVAALLDELGRRGVYSVTRAGVIYNRRLRNDAKLSRIRSEAGAKGAAVTNGKQSGNQVLPQQTSGKPSGKSPAPEARSQKPEVSPSGDTRASARDCPDKVEDQVWRDFLAMRKAKRAPVTETALTKIANQAELAGWSLNDALAECVARGWQGFKAEWVERRSVAPNGAARAPSEPMDFLDYKIEQRRRREEWERQKQAEAAK